MRRHRQALNVQVLAGGPGEADGWRAAEELLQLINCRRL